MANKKDNTLIIALVAVVTIYIITNSKNRQPETGDAWAQRGKVVNEGIAMTFDKINETIANANEQQRANKQLESDRTSQIFRDNPLFDGLLELNI